MLFKQSIKSMFFSNDAKIIAFVIVHTGSSVPKKMLRYCLFKIDNETETRSIPIFNYNPACQPESPSSREKIFVLLDENSEKEKLDLFILQYFEKQISEINISPANLLQCASSLQKGTNTLLYRYEINLVIDSTKIEAVKKYLHELQYELVEIDIQSSFFDNPIIDLCKRDRLSTVFNNQREA
jgi:hypothetical protein